MRQPEQLEQRADLLREPLRIHFAELADELEILGRRLERIENRLLRHVSETPAERDEIACDVAALEKNGAGRDLEKARDHLGCRGLAGSVRAEVADDFAEPDLEADVVDTLAEEAFDEIAGFGHGPGPAPAEVP